MSWLRGIFALLATFTLVIAAMTLVALEGQEVVVLHTRAPDGAVRTTRIWVADRDGDPWIEAASPARPFYQDIQRDPRVELERGGAVVGFVARPEPGDAGHQAIRGRLREKYGLADWWIGWLADTSRSIAVRLDPSSETTQRTVQGVPGASP